MSEIKPHIKVWWREGSQSQQLIRDGEVDMIAMWSARAVDLIDDKVPLELVWNGAEIFNSNLIVPKGDPIRLSRLLGPSLSSEKGRQGNRTPSICLRTALSSFSARRVKMPRPVSPRDAAPPVHPSAPCRRPPACFARPACAATPAR
jgi:hypothetical protein